MKRYAAQMKLSGKMAENKPDLLDGRTEQAVRRLPGRSVTGLPYLNGKPRCRRVCCVNHNGNGKRSGRLPGKSAAGTTSADGTGYGS